MTTESQTVLPQRGQPRQTGKTIDRYRIQEEDRSRMARQIRMEYAGAVYHVMARGNQGRAVFADDRDRTQWLETLGEA